jgi:hypothetical protein
MSDSTLGPTPISKVKKSVVLSRVVAGHIAICTATFVSSPVRKTSLRAVAGACNVPP